MIQRVPTEKYFIIRLHIGVKWSFDVYNMNQGSKPQRGAMGQYTRGKCLCDRGAHLSCSRVCQLGYPFLAVVCQMLHTSVCFFKYLFRFCLSLCPLFRAYRSDEGFRLGERVKLLLHVPTYYLF